MQLFANGEVPMTTLADAIGKDPSTVTALVNKLVDAGYVKTEKSTSDRRITNVKLTDAGRALEQGFIRVSRTLCEAMASELSEEELLSTRESLITMQESFKRESEGMRCQG